MKKGGSDRSAIAAAALRCFKRYGIQRTSMSDVADEAGLSRQTVYRAFESRSDLVQFILGGRIAAMGESLRPYFHGVASLEDALVEGSMLSIATARADKLFTQMIEHGTDHSLEQFMMRGSDEVRALMHDLWDPVLDTARTRGQLRPGLTNERIIAWIMTIHTVLTTRDDLDDKARRRLLKDFFVPSVLSPLA